MKFPLKRVSKICYINVFCVFFFNSKNVPTRYFLGLIDMKWQTIKAKDNIKKLWFINSCLILYSCLSYLLISLVARFIIIYVPLFSYIAIICALYAESTWHFERKKQKKKNFYWSFNLYLIYIIYNNDHIYKHNKIKKNERININITWFIITDMHDIVFNDILQFRNISVLSKSRSNSVN